MKTISKIEEINKKWDKFTIYYDCKWNNCPEGGKECYHANKENVKKFWNKQILSLIEELEGKLEDKEKWLGFFTEDIKKCFIPKCGWCGKIATEQTVKGKDAQESHSRPVNWGYYCKSCYAKGLKEEEEEAMYG